MMNKHTPPPWRKGKISDAVVTDNKAVCYDTKYEKECLNYYGGYLIAESIVPQNIDLITAAPELFEALEMAVEWLTNTPVGRSIPQVNGQPGEWLQKAREAIAKAKGETVNKIKAGDTVFYRPKSETWYILGVNSQRNKVCVAGWPPSEANLSDCDLVESGNGITQREKEYRDKVFGPNWEA